MAATFSIFLTLPQRGEGAEPLKGRGGWGDFAAA